METDARFYGQRQEDRRIAEYLGDIYRRPHGFYINIGAWHPVHDSVTKHFYDRGWRGINVEPVPFYYDLLLEQRRKDINLQMLVGKENIDEVEFTVLPTGISTLVPEYIEKWKAQGYQPETITLPMRTLGKVCRMYVLAFTDIEFMAIDVEGWEKDVLLGADFKRYRPRIIMLEATEPGTFDSSAISTHEDWEPILLEANYEFLSFDGLNRYYRRKE